MLTGLLLLGGSATAQWGPIVRPVPVLPVAPLGIAHAACVVNLPPGQWLNVRTRPNGVVVGMLLPGTPVNAFDSGGAPDGTWAYVSSPVTMAGWVFVPYLACRGPIPY
jgi:hypothetical protein